jgi:hypothetical protein
MDGRMALSKNNETEAGSARFLQYAQRLQAIAQADLAYPTSE